MFFLNTNRTLEQGSILKIDTKDGIIDIIPDYRKCVILENINYNYGHEVTKNLIDDFRFSLYNPFTINDYQTKMIHN